MSAVYRSAISAHACHGCFVLGSRSRNDRWNDGNRPVLFEVIVLLIFYPDEGPRCPSVRLEQNVDASPYLEVSVQAALRAVH